MSIRQEISQARLIVGALIFVIGLSLVAIAEIVGF